jgi:hypothetical protein
MCYIYRQRGGKNSRPRYVDRGENPPRVAAVPLVGPGKGRRTILCGLGCTYTEDTPTPCTGLNLIQHNTSNKLHSANNVNSISMPTFIIASIQFCVCLHPVTCQIITGESTSTEATSEYQTASAHTLRMQVVLVLRTDAAFLTLLICLNRQYKVAWPLRAHPTHA